MKWTVRERRACSWYVRWRVGFSRCHRPCPDRSLLLFRTTPASCFPSLVCVRGDCGGIWLSFLGALHWVPGCVAGLCVCLPVVFLLRSCKRTLLLMCRRVQATTSLANACGLLLHDAVTSGNDVVAGCRHCCCTGTRFMCRVCRCTLPSAASCSCVASTSRRCMFCMPVRVG